MLLLFILSVRHLGVQIEGRWERYIDTLQLTVDALEAVVRRVLGIILNWLAVLDLAPFFDAIQEDDEESGRGFGVLFLDSKYVFASDHQF